MTPVCESSTGWVRLPHGMWFAGDATAMTVDSRDHVIVFNLGSVPMVVFDSDGN